MKPPRIVLADDHVLLTEALKSLLEPEFEVVGTANNGRALLRMAEELKPDLIVLDISMSLLNGLDAGRRLRSILPSAKLVYLTMNQGPDFVTQAMQIGALGYVLKSSSAVELREAIRRSLRGLLYMSPTVRGLEALLGSPHRGRRKDKVALTSRQREVLQLLAEGRSMKEAGYLLNISVSTIAFHKYSMMRVFNIRSDAELFKLAARTHVVA
jgi:DNA-binding NarL/FixJ family response regulator